MASKLSTIDRSMGVGVLANLRDFSPDDDSPEDLRKIALILRRAGERQAARSFFAAATILEERDTS